MQKLSVIVLEKMIKANVTSKEIDFLLYIARFQNEYGIIKASIIVISWIISMYRTRRFTIARNHWKKKGLLNVSRTVIMIGILLFLIIISREKRIMAVDM